MTAWTTIIEPKNKIAVIGAGYLQLPLVLKAKEMGIETLCFAWEEGAVCKNYCDKFYPVSITESDTIEQICRDEHVGGIISIASDLAVTTVSKVAENLGLTGNPTSISLSCTDKYEMRSKFREHGLPVPEFFNFVRGKSTPAITSFPLIVKPVDRSGSRGISIVRNQDELVEALNVAVDESFSGQAIVEEFIEGSEVSVEAISWKGKHYILVITDKETSGEPHFVETAHHQPSQLPDSVLDDIKELTYKALDSLGIENGASHTEIKITPENKLKIIEVGARMGGDFIGSHLVELSTGYDFLKGVINICLGNFEIPKINNTAYSGVYFLSKESENLLPYFQTNKPDWLIQRQILDTELKYLKNSADRSGYLIYKSAVRLKLNQFICS